MPVFDLLEQNQYSVEKPRSGSKIDWTVQRIYHLFLGFPSTAVQVGELEWYCR